MQEMISLVIIAALFAGTSLVAKIKKWKALSLLLGLVSISLVFVAVKVGYRDAILPMLESVSEQLGAGF